ncbi:MAG: hypothetical protein JST54_22590 [Deltaproteobacteria bacterium]|nr:hypothetical protein [Deltaproteobacteria bacterium]
MTAERLAPQMRRYVDFKGPVAGRAMAAKGLVPLQGADFAHVMFMLTFDPDEKVRNQAMQTASAPDDRTKKVLLAALRDEDLEPPVLHFYAQVLGGKEDLLELICLNNTTADETIAEVVLNASPKLAELISQNQLRLLRTPLILRNLCGNPNASKATVDLACDFAVRSGVVMDDVPAMKEARIRIHGPDVIAAPPPADQVTADAILEEEKETLHNENAEPLVEGSQKKMTLVQKVMKMQVSEKIKLATLGNKEARTLLLRDSNKLVCMAAINSPRITDGEILLMAGNKTCNDDVLRYIYSNRSWTKNYKIKLALVRNPKVPAAIGMKFLSTLRDSELKDIAKDKNVPSAVQQQAKKMVDKKNAPVKVGGDH